MGDEHAGVLNVEGAVWAWGRNLEGELGIECMVNTERPMKTTLNVTELSCGGYHTVVKKIDEKLYAVGAYQFGRLGTNSKANVIKYTEIIMPNTNKAKYVKAGLANTVVLLKDGSIWETGFNLSGELGNGTTTNSDVLVQGLTEKGKALENVLMIGKNNGNIGGSSTSGYGLNTAVITKSGDVYTCRR